MELCDNTKCKLHKECQRFIEYTKGFEDGDSMNEFPRGNEYGGCEKFLPSSETDDTVPDSNKTVKEIQEERTAQYGPFEYNAKFVGDSIISFYENTINQGKKPSPVTLGAMAHIWIKQARLCMDTEMNNEDTMKDLESYANLSYEIKHKG